MAADRSYLNIRNDVFCDRHRMEWVECKEGMDTWQCPICLSSESEYTDCNGG